jgi:hypothetical protein
LFGSGKETTRTEEGYLDNLGVSQEEMGIVIDTTKTGLMVAENIFRSN